MNKKHIVKIAGFALLLASGLTSCELDQYPQDSMPIDQSWKLMSDAVNYETGLMSSFRGRCGDGAYNTDFQADLMNAEKNFGNNYALEHFWTFNDVPSVWAYAYSTIKECNNILTHIDQISPADADSQQQASNEATLKNIKGEAYFVRAFCYFKMATRYAKDYEASTAKTDLGLPLVESVDVNHKPNRSTLQETYDFIKKDLAAARQNLIKTNPGEDKSELTTDALDLLEARVDLYMDDYAGADELAQKLIQSGKYPLAAKADYAKMWTDDEGSEIIFAPYADVNEGKKNWSAYMNYDVKLQVFQPYFVPSQWVIDLYGANDVRKNIFFQQGTIQITGQNKSQIVMLSKFPGNPALKTNPMEVSYYNKMKEFRIAEAYLISAEARYRQHNEEGAKTVLNQLRAARGAAASTAAGAQLFNDIKTEWIREFIGEGYRLDCLKRWHDGFTRHDPQHEDVLWTMDPSVSINLKVDANDKRFVWEIPANDRQVNKNLVPNWDSNK